MKKARKFMTDSCNYGRPKKDASLTALLKAESRRICPADPQNRTWEDLLVRSMLQLALKGNSSALREVCERLDGKDSISKRNLHSSRLTPAQAVAMIDELYGLNQENPAGMDQT